MDEESRDSIGSAFHGKIMMISIAILFFACFFIVIFHLYARCFHHRRARVVRHAHAHAHAHRHGHLRRSHLHVLNAAVTSHSQGLDICVLKSIPTFIYASKSHESPLECVVCLSEFEDNEVGRVLPGCKHGFHVECIDMWFQSHSDCPLCRAQVQFQVVKKAIEPAENLHERNGSISEPAGSVTGSDCDRSSPLTPMVGGRIKSLQLNGLIHDGPIRLNESCLNLNYESDIESGSNPPASSVRVLKRLFSI